MELYVNGMTHADWMHRYGPEFRVTKNGFVYWDKYLHMVFQIFSGTFNACMVNSYAIRIRCRKSSDNEFTN